DLQLVLAVETVAALDLDSGRAAGEHLADARQRGLDERVFRGGARGGDGREDAAARAGDLGVRRAGQPPPQLVAPIAGIQRVRVRVDEAGHQRAPAAVDAHTHALYAGDRRAR